ncbi:MAG TPA: glycosyltransferase family 2 protein [Bryobacteraceae bacterium]|nr:glycosyltransferase family 2 protein [Bryobacteraceae bacterium]
MHKSFVKPISISIVICTHNRSSDAVECLDSLVSRMPDPNLEVIVIDSGSTDEHSLRIEQYVQDKPFVRYIKLDVPGTSLARNAGLYSARGDWVWWLDDDAIPMPDWPEKIFEVIGQADAKTAIIGGRVTPKFEENADISQLTDRWRLLLTCIEDEEPGYVADGRNIACANMLMKKEVATRLGGFSEELGRSPGQLMTGEESLLIEMMHSDGLKCAYAPALSVLHKVSSQRLTVEWVSQRAYWEGHVRYRVLHLTNRKLPWSLYPFKLRVSIYVLKLLLMLKPGAADIIIRMNLAKGTLDAIDGSR